MRTLPSSLSALAAAVLATFAMSAAAQGQVYKYTDANGQVHYADRAASDAKQVKGPTPPSQQTPARPAAPAAQPAAAQAPPALPVNRAQAQQVQRDVAVAREEQCKQSRENYEKAVRAQRVFKTNEKGEREFISPAEADALRLQIKAEMDGACGS
jgi:uncharacterized protein DUF4124